MSNRNVLVIGTSAGGVEALLFLARKFPRDLPAAVLITIHLASRYPSILDELLSRAGPLPAHFATDGEKLAEGTICIAPPERHLLVYKDRLRLGFGPRENNARPAIDPMFRSAAVCCGPRTVGVIMTGTLGDGASGLWALDQCGGITVVQDPADAAFPQMPETALSRVRAHHIAPLAELPALLNTLVWESAGQPVPVPEGILYEVEIARSGRSSMDEMDRLAERSVLSCPDCGGVMWEIRDGKDLRYRCHVGHAYSAELMDLAVEEGLRRALGSSQRALEERHALMKKLEEQATAQDSPRVASHWAQKASYFEREIDVIRAAMRRIDDLAATSAAKEPAES
jgi:two-component system chemotaxis response regulator CheB